MVKISLCFIIIIDQRTEKITAVIFHLSISMLQKHLKVPINSMPRIHRARPLEIGRSVNDSSCS